MSTDEATLLGILYTDGCVSPKLNSWRLYVSNTSWEVISIFKECLVKLFHISQERIRISQKFVNGKPFYKAVVDDKEIGWYLIHRFGTFRTLGYTDTAGEVRYPETNISFISQENEKIISQFLKVAFACDGGVNLYVARGNYTWLIRNVYLACKHPLLIIQYSELLKILGIRGQILKEDWLIRVQGREDLEVFFSKVGFLEGVRITQNSEYWEGYKKQEVLSLLVQSYGNPKIIFNLPQFVKSKDIVRTL